MINGNKTFRHELKYYINYFEYHSLRVRLNRVLQVDRHAKSNRDYHIRSLYFEDSESTAISEKQAGILERKKWRIRIYNLDDKVIKLEKKSRIGQFINKQSSNLTIENYYEIRNKKYEFLLASKDPLFIEFYSDLINQQFKPKVIVDYRREAYVSKLSNIRITFDKNLRTGLNSTNLFNKKQPTMNAIDENLMILEVKYDNFLPSYVKNILQLPSSQRSAISKYVICTKFTKTNRWEDQ
jgi:hypothetical protein